MPGDEVGFAIFGDVMQFVEIESDPGETVVAEAGAMMCLEEGITFETRRGDGSKPDLGRWGKLKGAGKRAPPGESTFMTRLADRGTGKHKLAVQPSVQYDIQRAGSFESMVFGGEGLFPATLRGTGRVRPQSLPFSRLAGRIALMGGGSGKDEGSVIGGLGSIFGRRRAPAALSGRGAAGSQRRRRASRVARPALDLPN